MKGVKSLISTIYDGSNKAYIYLWVSKEEPLVYVGQTNEKNGSYGRGLNHFQSNGTLRVRCSERVGVDIEHLSDLTLFSYTLPGIAEFTSTESAFRLAVEYLVQVKLYDARSRVEPVFQIISNIATSGYTNNSRVKQIASEIVEDFLTNYKSF